MRKINFIFCNLLFSLAAIAQPATLEYANESIGLTGVVRYNDTRLLGQHPVTNINYDDIAGTPYWSDNWNAALLTLKNGAVVKADKVKLNLYINEVVYKDNFGITQAAEAGLIKKINFFKGADTASIQSTLYYLKLPDDTVYHYYQVLNNGHSQLLKLKNIILFSKEPDVLSGKVELGFMPKQNYFLLVSGVVYRVNSINRENIFKIIQKTPEMEKWLSENNNKLRNEEDAVQFLNYLNG